MFKVGFVLQLESKVALFYNGPFGQASSDLGLLSEEMGRVAWAYLDH